MRETSMLVCGRLRVRVSEVRTGSKLACAVGMVDREEVLEGDGEGILVEMDDRERGFCVEMALLEW